jgi:predicted murein hydrolase (TIGR00659 family)
MLELTQSPLFGILLTIVAYQIGVACNWKLRSPIVNPLLIAIAIAIGVLLIFRIPLEHYNQGGDIVYIFLSPATAALAISIYDQLRLLKKYWLPVLVGTGVGALMSIVCVSVLCRLFVLEEDLTAALLPKSVTMPIALELSEQYGGLLPITVTAVVITGVLGAVAAPWLIRLFRLDHPVAAGVAIGTSSHAAGTTKAIELGEVEAAMSGISIGLAGIYTFFFLTLFG